MAEALLAFGGNLGQPAETIRAALRLLGERGVRIATRSGFYRTAPWGPVPQPDFVNLCAAAETRLDPRTLLCTTQAIERELGREPGVRWGPRTLDIDILAYDDLVLNEPGLRLPHPHVAERAFVLIPLAEIAPNRLIAGRTVRDMAAALGGDGVTRLPG